MPRPRSAGGRSAAGRPITCRATFPSASSRARAKRSPSAARRVRGSLDRAWDDRGGQIAALVEPLWDSFAMKACAAVSIIITKISKKYYEKIYV